MCDEHTADDNEAYLAGVSRRQFGVMTGAMGLTMLLPAPANAAVTKGRDVSITTPDGKADAYFVAPATGKHPGVLVWPDVMGLRPAFRQMADRLAQSGYAVLVVNQFYRSTKAPFLNPGESYDQPAVRARIAPFRDALSADGTVRDAKAFTAFIDAQPQTDRKRGLATTGYCMGGPMVLRTAAAVPNRIRAGATFHGGGFVTQSAASPVYQRFLNSLAARAGLLVVSVNYRLAPEHPLPAGYEDSLRAFKWAVSDGGDPWLSQHGDLGRLFLAGDSAGGNIVHNVAMMAAAEGEAGSAAGARIEGAVLLHAGFGGREPIDGETPEWAAFSEKLWAFAFPEATDGADDPRMNPLVAAAPSLRNLPCKRVLVCAAERGSLRPRDRAYYEALAASGWSGAVEWFETKGQEHVFFLFKPGCDEAVALMDRLVAFFAGK